MNTKQTKHDPVNSPKHYRSHKSGIECIQITEHMNFCLGNAMKCIWRADLKSGHEDLQKAIWYINREIERREKALPTLEDFQKMWNNPIDGLKL